MSLKDLFETDKNGNYKSHLGSGGEALLEEVNKEYAEEQEEQQQEGGFDDLGGLGQNDQMMSQSGPSALDVRAIDRFVRIRGWPKNKNGDKNAGMWDDPEFLETLKTNFLSDRDQKRIWRSYLDISDLSSGDGNAELASAHGKALAIKVLMKHSGTENGLEANERTLWTENRSVNKQILRNSGTGGRGASSSFLSRLFGR